MRRRAYRPEVTDCLEDRSLLSAVGGLSADPVILPRLRLATVVGHIHQGFLLLSLNRIPVPHLDEEIRDVVVMLPFGRTDGLGVSINRILDRFHEDLAAHVPHAIRSANQDVLDVIRAQVQARVRSGDVIVR